MVYWPQNGTWREKSPIHSSFLLAPLEIVVASGPGSTNREGSKREGPPALFAKLPAIQPTSWNGGLLRFSFSEREGEEHYPPSSSHYFSPRGLFAVGFGWEGRFVSLFLPGPSLPAEAQVYNGKLAPLTVLLVGNCYEITVILPRS